ncbi:MAG: tetratricopeptide repeat protein, partial [Deltaproteobacteria bacterium]|nr:tetratricopeptide repeat protein [Deltaproteobacteria bacterium]
MNQKKSDIAKMLESGRSQMQAGRLQQAESVFHKILQHDSRQPEALYLAGIIALQTGQNQKAAGLLGQAVSVQPDNPHFLYHLGLAAMALNNIDM